MELTKEFIELQGFKHLETEPDEIYVFSIQQPYADYELIWDKGETEITIIKSEDDEPETEIFTGKIASMFHFVKLLIILEELTNKAVAFPDDFVELFMVSDYPYAEQEFNEMCEACIVILLAYENYEFCPKFIEFRKNYITNKEWEYVEMPDHHFKDYSNITTKEF